MKMERVSTPTAYGTSLILMLQEWFSSVSRDDVTFYMGLLLGVGTFAINWYYKAKDDKRKEQSSRFSISPID